MRCGLIEAQKQAPWPLAVILRFFLRTFVGLGVANFETGHFIMTKNHRAEICLFYIMQSTSKLERRKSQMILLTEAKNYKIGVKNLQDMATPRTLVQHYTIDIMVDYRIGVEFGYIKEKTLIVNDQA